MKYWILFIGFVLLISNERIKSESEKDDKKQDINKEGTCFLVYKHF